MANNVSLEVARYKAKQKTFRERTGTLEADMRRVGLKAAIVRTEIDECARKIAALSEETEGISDGDRAKNAAQRGKLEVKKEALNAKVDRLNSDAKRIEAKHAQAKQGIADCERKIERLLREDELDAESKK